MKVALFPIGWSLRTNEWFQSVSLIFVFFFSDPMCVRLKRLSVLTTTQRWNSFVLSLSLLSLSKSFLNKTRLPNARGRRQHKENLSRSRGTLFRFRFCSRNARRECFSTRENFRALFNDDLLFFLGQKQPVWVEKDSRNSLRAFAFKSQKRSIMCENEWCDLFLSLSLSLSGKRARARRNARKNTRV